MHHIGEITIFFVKFTDFLVEFTHFFVATDVYALPLKFLKSLLADFFPHLVWAKFWVPLLCWSLVPDIIFQSPWTWAPRNSGYLGTLATRFVEDPNYILGNSIINLEPKPIKWLIWYQQYQTFWECLWKELECVSISLIAIPHSRASLSVCMGDEDNFCSTKMSKDSVLAKCWILAAISEYVDFKIGFIETKKISHFANLIYMYKNNRPKRPKCP